MTLVSSTTQLTEVSDPPLARFLFADRRMAPIWLVVRLYVGWQWLTAGWGKITGTEGIWIGPGAGKSIAGFVAGALHKTSGPYPSVQPYYAWFLQNLVLPHAALWSHIIAFGEVLVGLALILGLFTGIAAFFGGFMNANYLLAGTVSTNPALFVLATWLVLAWKIAGYFGLDFFALPRLGVTGAPEVLVQRFWKTLTTKVHGA